MKARKCVECDLGEYEPIARHGRMTTYKNATFELPNEFVLLECRHCGSRLIGSKEARQLDEYLDAQYKRLLYTTLLQALDILVNKIPQRQLERMLGISQGYLSKLRSQERLPSPELVSLLALLSHDPARLAEVHKLWNPREEAVNIIGDHSATSQSEQTSDNTYEVAETTFPILAERGEIAVAVEVTERVRATHTILVM